MADLREAAQQALAALEIGYDSAQAEAAQFHAAMAGYRPERHAAMDADVAKIAAAITALKDALAEQEDIAQNLQSRLDAALLLEERRQEIAQPRHETEQEPVAWRYKGMIGSPWSLSDDGYYASCKRDKGYIVENLYTHPPRREWQSLTDREAKDTAYEVDANGGSVVEFARAIEAKLKEKNNG